jgi:hypothetical protein
MNTTFRLQNHIAKRTLGSPKLKWESGQLSRYSDGLLAGLPGFDSQKGQESILYSTALRQSLGLTQPLVCTDGSFPEVIVAGA